MVSNTFYDIIDVRSAADVGAGKSASQPRMVNQLTVVRPLGHSSKYPFFSSTCSMWSGTNNSSFSK